ncbi:MAG: hypothetical protein U0670_20170 [Anaerolineae bacterium]
MTQPDHAEQIAALQGQFQELEQESQFDSIRQDMEAVAEQLRNLPDDIAAVRKRGYVFASYLEHKVEVLSSHWSQRSVSVRQMISHQAALLRDDVLRARALLSAGKDVGAITNAVNNLQSQINTIKSNLSGQFSQLASDVSSAVAQVESIEWALSQRDEASFPFLADENVFLAAKAEYVATGRGKDDPDGILYLTDQRLVFEQKETTGKTLGLFGGKKTQELEWQVPLNQIGDVKAENKGLFGGKDMLNFTFKPGAPMNTAVVEVKGGVNCKFWAAQITRMIRDGASDERAIQPDAETLNAIRSAPTACPVCAATLPVLVANQRQLECEFCGAVIRV